MNANQLINEVKSQNTRKVNLLTIGGFGILLLGTVVGLESVSAAGLPFTSCREGFRQAGPRLCISQKVQDATYFDLAMLNCRHQRAYVASYGDLYYLYNNTKMDATYNPKGKWLGPDLINDDRALCGNTNITIDGENIDNFEGTCHKRETHGYWCAHDVQ